MVFEQVRNIEDEDDRSLNRYFKFMKFPLKLGQALRRQSSVESALYQPVEIVWSTEIDSLILACTREPSHGA